MQFELSAPEGFVAKGVEAEDVASLVDHFPGITFRAAKETRAGVLSSFVLRGKQNYDDWNRSK